MRIFPRHQRHREELRATWEKRIAAFVLFATCVSMMPASVYNTFIFVEKAQAAEGIYAPIHYQGKVSTTAGSAIADGDYNMRFSIYDAASGGTQLWTETWDDGTTQVTMTGGLFSVGLGTHTAMSGVDFNDDSLFLQVEFDPGNDDTYEETFSPRRRFHSVPYAHNADTVDGLDGTQFIRADADDTATGTITFTNAGVGIEVQGALSGARLLAQDTLASSGNLVWEGSASGSSLWVSQFEGAGLQDCDAASNALQWDETTKQFSCTTISGSGGGGASTGSLQSAFDDRYVNVSGDTMTGALTINLSSGTIGLNVLQTISGASVFAQNSLLSSGSVVWEGTASGNALHVMNNSYFLGDSIGFGTATPDGYEMVRGSSYFKFYDYDGAANQGLDFYLDEGDYAFARLQVNNEEGWNISYGTGSTTDYFIIGESMILRSADGTNATQFEVDENGALLRRTSGTAPITFEARGTVSGFTVFSSDALRSSGSVVWEGSASGALLWVSQFEGAGLEDCDSANNALQWDATSKQFSCVTISGSGGGGGGSGSVFPSRATMWHEDSTITNGNAFAIVNQSAHIYQTLFYQNAPADGDEFTNGFLLKAGTYTFSVLGSTWSDRGIIDWYIDDVLVVDGQDWYGSNAYAVTKTATVTVSGDGYHVLRGVVNGKNASSSSFIMALTKFSLKPTEDNQNIGVASTGTTLQQAYGNDENGGSAVVLLTSTDDSVEFRNPASQGTDSGALVYITDLAGDKDGLDIAIRSGTSTDAALRLSTQGASHILFGSGSASYDVNLYRSAANILKTDDSLYVLNTISGSTLFANNSLRSSGSVVWEGSASGALLWVSQFEGAGLEDCDAASNALQWDETTKQFSCTTISGSGGEWSGTGALQNAFDNRYVNVSGDTMTGALTINLSSGTIGLNVLQTISGATIFATNALTSSGTLTVEGNSTFGDQLFADQGNSMAPAYSFIGDPNTGIYSGADDTLSFTLGGSIGIELTTTEIRLRDTVVLNQAGSAGTPTINWGSNFSDSDTGFFSPDLDQIGVSVGGAERLRVSGTGIEVFGTISGSTLFANNSLRSSGSVVWEGSASGALLWVSQFEGAGLTDCDASSSVVKWDATSKQFSCGTVTAGASTGSLQNAFDNRYVNVSGDTMTGALTINLSSGTVGLNVLQTISGATVFAQNSLRSSGSLVWEGAATGASLWASTIKAGSSLISSGTLTIDGNANFGSGITVTGSRYLQTQTAPIARGRFADTASTHLTDPFYSDVVYPYMYVTAEGSNALQIFDISDPDNPVATGSLVDSGGLRLSSARQIKVVGRYAYITSVTDSGLQVVDVSDPSNPIGRGSIGNTNPNVLDGAMGIDVQGNYAYVSAFGENGVQIIDITDPDNLVAMGSVTDGTNLDGAHALVVRGNYAYVAAFDVHRITVLDVSDPTNPFVISSIQDDGSTYFDNPAHLRLVGNLLYVAGSGENGLQIIDVTDPYDPRPVGSVNGSQLGTPYDVEVAGNYAYVANFSSDSVAAIDISDPTNPTIVGTIENTASLELNNASSIQIHGRYAYVTGYNDDGIQILELAGLTAPSAYIGAVETTSLSVQQDATFEAIRVHQGVEVGGTFSVSQGASITSASGIALRVSTNDASAGAALEVMGALSGTTIYLSDNLYASGGIVWEGTASGVSLWSSVINAGTSLSSSGDLVWEGSASGALLWVSQFEGAGLTDCDTTGDGLQWDATTKQFICVANVGAGASTGSLQTAFDDRYVNVSGDTMTGTLVINLDSGTVGLNVLQTISGATVFATNTLSSSGTLNVEGDAYIDGTTFVVDATDNQVGIGETSPDALLHLTASSPELRIETSDDSQYTRVVRSPGSNTVTWYNQVAQGGSSGSSGSAIAFSGPSEYVSVPLGGGLNNAQTASISMWVRWTGTQDNAAAGFGPVTARQSNGDFSNQVIGLSTNNPDTAKIRWYPYSTTAAITSATTPGSGVWRHVVVTYESGDHTLYVDGVEDGSSSTTGTISDDNSVALSIGGWIGAGNGYCTCEIDEFRVYDKILSPSEVSDQYNDGQGIYGDPTESGLVYGWHFDEGAGTTTTDYSALGLDATLTNGPTWTGGIVDIPSITEVAVWSSQDGAEGGEKGIVKFGTGGGTWIQGQSIRMYAGDIERMRFTSGGLIGVGTLTPGAKFSVSGATIIGNNIGSASADTQLEVIGTISGSTLFAQDTIFSSGGLVWETTASGASLWSSIINAGTTLASSGGLVWEGSASGALLWVSQFEGAGLEDCDGASDKLLWDATTKQFSCGTESGGSGLSESAADDRYVNISGDTMTGTLNITHLTANSTALQLIGSGSFNLVSASGGSIIHTARGNPALVGTYNTSGSAENVAVFGRYAYVADSTAGLQIIDISNPRAPSLAGTYDTAGTAWEVVVDGLYAYVADEGEGMQIIDISNPSAPFLVGTYNTPGDAEGIDIAGIYAYVADSEAGLQIIDISNPHAPELVGTYDSTLALAVEVRGNYAYVADGTDGFRVVDVSNAAKPQLVGTVDTASTALGVDVVGNYAYVTDFLNGLHIIDISDPTSPSNITNIDPGGFFYDVSVAGRYAYVAESLRVHVIDVDIPSSPAVVGSYPTAGISNGIDVVGRYAYVADDDSGLQILELNGTYTPTLEAGTLDVALLDVRTNATIDGNLALRGGLNVGRGGIMSQGSLAIFTGSGGNGATGALIRSHGNTGALLALDSYAKSAAAPHIAFGYQGNFDVVLWRSSGSTLSLSGHFLPGLDDTFDLGSTAFRWRDLYVGPGSIHIGTDSDNEGVISFNTETNDLEFDVTGDGIPEFSVLNGGVISSSTLSGTMLKAGQSISSSGTLVWEGAGSGASLWIGTLEGAGLTDCDAANNALQWDATTKKFSCTTISGGGGDLSESSADERYVNVSGDTMTGALNINISSGTIGLNVLQTISGASIFAANSLRSSGSVIVDAPTSPEIIGEIKNVSTLSGVRDVVVAGRYAYVANGSDDSMRVIDISNPISPEIVGGIKHSSYLNGAYALAVADNYAYVANYNDNSMRVIDISNPESPSIIGGVKDDTLLNGASEIAVVGRYAYVVSTDSNAMRIIDISNPSNPLIVGGIEDASNLNLPFGIAVEGSYAYVTSINDDSLQIINISNPSNPFIIGSVQDATDLDQAYNVAVAGRYAYVVNYGDDSMRIIDVSDPTDPTIVGGVKDSRLAGAYRIEVAGRYAYVVNLDDDSMRIIDVSNPALPVIVGGIKDTADLNGAISIDVVGRYAYVVSFSDSSLQVIDLKGIEASSASIGSLDAGSLQVLGNTHINGNLTLRGGINVGLGGIRSSGPMAIFTGSGGNGMTGAIIRSQGNTGALLALDSYKQSAAAPHILFGYRGNFDTALYRSSGATLTLSGSLAVANKLGVGTEYAQTALDVRSSIVSEGVSIIYAENETFAASITSLFANRAASASYNFLAAASDQNGTPDTEFVLRGDGNAFADGTWSGGGADLAEYFETMQGKIATGSLIAVDSSNPNHVVAATATSSILVGIVSTNPGLVANGGGADEIYDRGADPRFVLVGLVGQVPTRVSAENGSINIGDLITVSSVPGVGRKANEGEEGIAVALEAYSGTGESLIQTYVGSKSRINTVEPSYETLTVSGSATGALLIIESDTTDGSQDLLRVISNVGGTGNTVFRVNGSGAVYSDSTFNSNGADYAEWFRESNQRSANSGQHNKLQPGEVVCIDVTQNNTVKRCEHNADTNVMGIVSTNPAFIGNSVKGGTVDLKGLPIPGYVLVGLIGQVPAKSVVETFSGSQLTIRPGDALTPASIPGYVRRALPGEPTVGVALEGLSEGEGIVNVLISRRNSSVTVERVEQEIIEAISAMEIGDEVEIMVAEALENLNVSDDIEAQIAEQLTSLSLNTRLEELEAAIAALQSGTGSVAISEEGDNEAEDNESSETTTIQTGDSLQLSHLQTDSLSVVQTLTISGSLSVGQQIQSQFADIQETLSVGGDTRVGGDLYLEGSLITEDLFVPGSVRIDNLLQISRLEAGSGSVFDGDVTVNGRLKFASGSSMSISSLIVEDSLEVIGDITIAGLARFLQHVRVDGELQLSNKHAGYALVPRTGTSVTVLFSTGFVATPIVTASPDYPVLYAVTQTTQTGFTIQLGAPAPQDVTFGWHATGVIDPQTSEGLAPGGSIRFPVDERGIPLSSNLIWNQCIRRYTPIDENTGKPYNCARYRDGGEWWHPDLQIFFVFDDTDYPYVLELPEGYEPYTIVPLAPGDEESSSSSSSSISSSEQSSDVSSTSSEEGGEGEGQSSSTALSESSASSADSQASSEEGSVASQTSSSSEAAEESSSSSLSSSITSSSTQSSTALSESSSSTSSAASEQSSSEQSSSESSSEGEGGEG